MEQKLGVVISLLKNKIAAEKVAAVAAASAAHIAALQKVNKAAMEITEFLAAVVAGGGGLSDEDKAHCERRMKHRPLLMEEADAAFRAVLAARGVDASQQEALEIPRL